MPSLEVISPVEDEVVASYSFVGEKGATVSVSGFHGTQTYTLSDHDHTLIVRFTGVTDFTESTPVGLQTQKQRAELPEGARDDEEGAEESDAEQMQRENAEAVAKANDERANKGKAKQYVMEDASGTDRTVTLTEVEEPKASTSRSNRGVDESKAPQSQSTVQHAEKSTEKSGDKK